MTGANLRRRNHWINHIARPAHEKHRQNPEATAEAFRGGWFHSGDLVRADAEGFLYVVAGLPATPAARS
jgi:acyl-CoA synthetase (AMP-forming)/AMP-acid ligase II